MKDVGHWDFFLKIQSTFVQTWLVFQGQVTHGPVMSSSKHQEYTAEAYTEMEHYFLPVCVLFLLFILNYQ